MYGMKIACTVQISLGPVPVLMVVKLSGALEGRSKYTHLSKFIFGKFIFCFSFFSLAIFLRSDLDKCFCDVWPPIEQDNNKRLFRGAQWLSW